MRIGIIGAGFAGLSTAKVLRAYGHDVTVFDKSPDVGGVWSATRRYPGLTTQNNKSTYGFSDFPMPKSYPEWPSGSQVQAYLQCYAELFGLLDDVHLSSEVVSASLDEEESLWTLRVRHHDVTSAFECDHLVVCNGIFSDPLVPAYPGADEFVLGGGRICHATQFTDLSAASGQHVLVVGYGKSSCDVAAAASDVAASTTVVARELIWKMPKRLAGLNYKYLLLTRMGEALFPYVEPGAAERLLHGRRLPVGRGMLRSVESQVARQLRLRQLGLLPVGSLERIARSTVSLATDGFYDLVASGAIGVRRETSVIRLCVVDGQPSAELSTGEVVRADLVICGTGFHQRVPFFSEELQARLSDERGNFQLFRQILPLDVPALSFHGYNSSFFSPLSAEVAALWTADLLDGDRTLPSVEDRRTQIEKRLQWMEERTEGKHARGTNIIPFSVHNIDEMLSDLGVDVPARTRMLQWLLPLDPRAYRAVADALLERHAGRQAVRVDVSARV